MLKRSIVLCAILALSAAKAVAQQTQQPSAPPWDYWFDPKFMWGGGWSSFWWICALMMLAMMFACRFMCSRRRD